MATCRRCGKDLETVSGLSVNSEIPASWRAERMLRFMFFPARRAIVVSGLIATYAPLVFLTAVIFAVGAGVAWLVFFAHWSYLQEQNLALPIIVVVLFVIGVLIVLSIKILEATRAAQYCTSCLAYLVSQRGRWLEELGPHKVKTKKS